MAVCRFWRRGGSDEVDWVQIAGASKEFSRIELAASGIGCGYHSCNCNEVALRGNHRRLQPGGGW